MNENNFIIEGIDYISSDNNGDDRLRCIKCNHIFSTKFKFIEHQDLRCKELIIIGEEIKERKKIKELVLTYTEKVDMVMFKKIVNNFDTLFESGKLGRFVDKNYNVIENKESIKTIVKKMYFNKLQSEEVEYRYVGKQTEGRLYSKIASLQGISRVIRHSLAKNIYWDIDMNNAHPVILRFYCEENNIPCSNLIYYNENRNDCFKSLMDKFNMSRDEAKKIPLTSINGGLIYEDCPKWMIDLHEELFLIRDAICKLNPLYVKRAKENYDKKLKARNETLRNPKNKSQNKPLFENINGSACNYMLCKYENIILQCCLKKIKEMGLTVGALVFDGFMCYRKDGVIIEDLLVILEEEILRDIRIPIKLSEKGMDEGLNLDEFEVNNLPLDEFDGIVRLDDYVCPSIFSSSAISIVRAGLGRGKSTASISYINNNHFNKIFIITPRKTYAESIVNRFNKESNYKFELYSDKKIYKDYYIENPSYIVVQCESLHRLVNYGTEGLCVIIDEIESFLTQLTSTKTHKKNHLENIKIFEMLCYSSKVIGMDAFISEKSFNVFKLIGLDVNYYNYIKPLEKRTYTEINSVTVSIPSKNPNLKPKNKVLYFEPFVEKIEELVFSGKKMFLFISSVAKLELLKERLISRGLNKDRIASYSSKGKDELDDVNSLWVNKDVVICTSSLTVGVNFDIPNHFHSIGIYLSATSRNLVRDVFQSMYRVRHLIDNKLYFILDTNHHGICEPTFKNIIKNDLLTKEDNILNLYKKYKIEKNEECDRIEWLEELYINNILEHNISIMTLQNEFFKYLKYCNYEKEDGDAHDDMKDLEIIEDHVGPIINYIDIPSINSDEMKILRMLNIKTELEISKLEKFFFQQSIENMAIEDETICWGLYMDYGKNKFRNISYEKGIRGNTIGLGDIINTTLPILAEKLSLRLEIIQNLTSWFNVENSHDIKTTIEDKKIQLLIPIFKENIKAIYDAFDIRETRKEEGSEMTTTNIIKITNQVLNKWGFSKIKRSERVNKRIEGKRVSNSSFKIENEGGIYDKIKPKRRNRSPKKS